MTQKRLILHTDDISKEQMEDNYIRNRKKVYEKVKSEGLDGLAALRIGKQAKSLMELHKWEYIEKWIYSLISNYKREKRRNTNNRYHGDANDRGRNRA